jgi:UDP-2,3-diacylglucosamine pyrophosphatase LpxH
MSFFQSIFSKFSISDTNTEITQNEKKYEWPNIEEYENDFKYCNENVYSGYNKPRKPELDDYYLKNESLKNQSEEKYKCNFEKLTYEQKYNFMMDKLYPNVFKIENEINNRKENFDNLILEDTVNLIQSDQTVYVDIQTFKSSTVPSVYNPVLNNFLIISDIHLSLTHPELNTDAFLKSCTSMVEKGMKYDALLIAGDLTQIGTDSELILVSKLFNDVLDTKITKNIIFIAGNHDYKRFNNMNNKTETVDILNSQLKDKPKIKMIVDLNKITINNDEINLVYLCDSLVVFNSYGKKITIFGSPISHSFNDFSFYNGSRGFAVMRKWEKIYNWLKINNSENGVWPTIMMTHNPELYGYNDYYCYFEEDKKDKGLIVHAGDKDFTEVYLKSLRNDNNCRPITAFVSGHIHELPIYDKPDDNDIDNFVNYKSTLRLTRYSRIIDNDGNTNESNFNGVVISNVSVNKTTANICQERKQLLSNEPNNFYTSLTVGLNMNVVLKYILSELISTEKYEIFPNRRYILFGDLGKVYIYFNKAAEHLFVNLNNIEKINKIRYIGECGIDVEITDTKLIVPLLFAITKNRNQNVIIL